MKDGCPGGRAALRPDAAVAFKAPNLLPGLSDVNRVSEFLSGIEVQGFCRTVFPLFEYCMTCKTIVGDDRPLTAFVFAVMAPHASPEDEVAYFVWVIGPFRLHVRKYVL